MLLEASEETRGVVVRLGSAPWTDLYAAAEHPGGRLFAHKHGYYLQFESILVSHDPFAAHSNSSSVTNNPPPSHNPTSPTLVSLGPPSLAPSSRVVGIGRLE